MYKVDYREKNNNSYYTKHSERNCKIAICFRASLRVSKLLIRGRKYAL